MTRVARLLRVLARSFRMRSESLIYPIGKFVVGLQRIKLFYVLISFNADKPLYYPRRILQLTNLKKRVKYE